MRIDKWRKIVIVKSDRRQSRIRWVDRQALSIICAPEVIHDRTRRITRGPAATVERRRRRLMEKIRIVQIVVSGARKQIFFGVNSLKLEKMTILTHPRKMTKELSIWNCLKMAKRCETCSAKRSFA